MENKMNNNNYGNANYRNNNSSVSNAEPKKGFWGSVCSFVTSKWGITTIVGAVVAGGAGYFYLRNKKKKNNPAEAPKEIKGDNE